MSDEQRAPPRLRQTLGPAGDCVREVLAEQELARPLPRFTQLQERRSRRVRRQRGLSLVVLAAAAALFGVRALRQDDVGPGIAAELTAGSSKRATPAARAAAQHEPPAAQEPSLAVPYRTEAPTPAAPKLARPSELPARVNELGPAQPADALQPTPGEGAGTAKACAQLARAGAAEQALGCYEQLSTASGMTGELALFEQARLEGKVLRKPERALRTLSEYRRRFPNGSLRGEVMLAQIAWLQATGDSARALELVDEALGSGLLRERTAELSRLRTTLSAGRD